MIRPNKKPTAWPNKWCTRWCQTLQQLNRNSPQLAPAVQRDAATLRPMLSSISDKADSLKQGMAPETMDQTEHFLVTHRAQLKQIKEVLHFGKYTDARKQSNVEKRLTVRKKLLQFLVGGGSASI